jgi:hypothetical protein
MIATFPIRFLVCAPLLGAALSTSVAWVSRGLRLACARLGGVHFGIGGVVEFSRSALRVRSWSSDPAQGFSLTAKIIRDGFKRALSGVHEPPEFDTN